jgi:hypothetical protein
MGAGRRVTVAASADDERRSALRLHLLHLPVHRRRHLASVLLAGALCTGVSIAGTEPLAAASSPRPMSALAPVPSPAGPTVPWSPAPVQSPPGGLSNSQGGFAQLSVGNITCLSNVDCIAAGYLQLANPAANSYPPKAPQSLYHPVLWQWDGHSWAYDSSGTQGSVGLVGSACVSATDCWAVGGQFVGKLGNQSVGVIIHFDGKSWSPSAFPSPAGAAFNGVACPSLSECLVAGNRQTSTDAAHVLVEAWDGKSWRTMSAPSPKGALWSVLESLTCFSATYCLALGDADNSTKGPGRFFAERFNGTTWSIVPDRDTEQFNMGNASGLFEISCTSRDDCLAVGSALYYTHGEMGADFPAGAAETWDGSSWSAASPTPVADGGALVLNGVSCTSDAGCWVAMSLSGPINPFSYGIPLAHWNGSSFSVSMLKIKGFLAGIACLPENVGTWCVGLGEAPGAKGNSAVMAGGDFLITSPGPLRGAPKS